MCTTGWEFKHGTCTLHDKIKSLHQQIVQGFIQQDRI